MSAQVLRNHQSYYSYSPDYQAYQYNTPFGHNSRYYKNLNNLKDQSYLNQNNLSYIQQRSQQDNQIDCRLKTSLCRNYIQKGYCPYEDKCQYAHGAHELRCNNVQYNIKYKTRSCYSYLHKGFCPYGQRCNYLHKDYKPVNNQQKNKKMYKRFRYLFNQIKYQNEGSRLLNNLGIEENYEHINHIKQYNTQKKEQDLQTTRDDISVNSSDQQQNKKYKTQEINNKYQKIYENKYKYYQDRYQQQDIYQLIQTIKW